MSSTKPQVIGNSTELYYELEGQKYSIEVREASDNDDFNAIVNISLIAFPHDHETIEYARKWIQDHWKNHYYVITYNKTNVVGYILWLVKGGYKQTLTCELDQVAIDVKYRHQGFASYLMQLSLIKFQSLHQQLLQFPTLKIGIVFIQTGCTNYEAHGLYKKALQIEKKSGEIGALYGQTQYGDEVIIMVNEHMEPVLEKLLDQYKNFV